MRLDDRRIDLWTVDLDAPPAVAARFATLLTPEEANRAGRFHFDHLRRNYTVARGALRLLLGRYLDIAPQRIELKTGVRGKPAVADSSLSFNVSHSGTVALFAFTDGCELGVDIEEIRPLSDLSSLASRFFCAAEAAQLHEIPAVHRTRAFFRCWTRKEAYIKAIGEGLHAPLDRFRVTLRAEDEPRFVQIDGDVCAAGEWRLHDLDLLPAYAAALAYRDEARPVCAFPVMAAEQLDHA